MQKLLKRRIVCQSNECTYVRENALYMQKNDEHQREICFGTPMISLDSDLRWLCLATLATQQNNQEHNTPLVQEVKCNMPSTLDKLAPLECIPQVFFFFSHPPTQFSFSFLLVSFCHGGKN